MRTIKLQPLGKRAFKHGITFLTDKNYYERMKKDDPLFGLMITGPARRHHNLMALQKT